MKTVTLIKYQELDKIVTETYDRPYSFQQQEGCKDCGIEYFTLPMESEDYENNFDIEELDGVEGVPFSMWLSRDPFERLPTHTSNLQLELWWKRSFYPHISMVLNDLHEKGLMPSGDVLVEIDW